MCRMISLNALFSRCFSPVAHYAIHRDGASVFCKYNHICVCCMQNTKGAVEMKSRATLGR